jgi:hypothetical protein
MGIEYVACGGLARGQVLAARLYIPTLVRRVGHMPQWQSVRKRKYGIKRKIRKSLMLPRLQQHGFTHPQNGYWLMLPQDFAVLVAYETKAVVQVVLEVLQRTIGMVGEGPCGRKLWTRLSTWECAETGLMSPSAAERGLKDAVSRGYLLRRVSEGRLEYAIKWKGMNN